MRTLSKLSRITAVLLIPVMLVGCVNILPYLQLGATLAVQVLQILPSLGVQVSPADLAAVQAYSQSASVVWADVNSVYATYNANKSAGNLAALTAALQKANVELPALLAAAHISNTTLVGKLESGTVTMLDILQTIATFEGITLPPPANARFAALMPAPGRKSIVELKAEWNSTVCAGMTGRQLATCSVR